MTRAAAGKAQEKALAPMQAAMCAALAHPRRILMLCALAERPYHVSALAAHLGMRQPVASRHLRVLREEGLVYAERKGSRMEYRLSDPRLVEALRLLREVLKDRIAQRVSLLRVPTPPADAG